MLTTIPANRSRMECCFTNTVEAQMKTESTATPQRHLRNPQRAENAPAVAAAQPMTCMLGRTFVFVSAA